MKIKATLLFWLATALLACGWPTAQVSTPQPAPATLTNSTTKIVAMTATPTLDPRRVAVIIERHGLPVTPTPPAPVEPTAVTFFNHNLPTATLEPQLSWPIDGDLTQAFGCSPFYSGLPGEGCPADAPWFHDGIDLAAPIGTPVRAALGGTVIFAGADTSGPDCGDDFGYGLGIVIEGDGWQALYAHLSEIWATEGQTIEPGAPLGAVGQSGCASGPHLHFSLKRDGELVNPLGYMKAERR